MSEKLLDTIRNARDGSMVDIRYESDGKGAIASFPIAELQKLVEHLVDEYDEES